MVKGVIGRYRRYGRYTFYKFLKCIFNRLNVIDLLKVEIVD